MKNRQYLPQHISHLLNPIILRDRALEFEKFNETYSPLHFISNLQRFQRSLAPILAEVIIWKVLFSSIITTLLRIFRVERRLYESKHSACMFDLTRQHLPPFISEPELEEFFFQEDRPILMQDTRRVFILLNGYKTSTISSSNLIFEKSFLQLTQHFFPSRMKEFKAVLLSSFYVFYSSLYVVRNSRIRHILLDLFEIKMFLSSELSDSLLESIITTSSFNKSPSIFYILEEKRAFQTEMIHYSENSFPLTIQEKIPPLEIDWIANSRVDLHKVWTSNFEVFLQQHLPNVKISALGSIIFQKFPEKSHQFKKKNQIAVFDVVPSAHESLNGAYTTESGTRFLCGLSQIKDCLDAVLKDPPILVIKSKRRTIPAHNSIYLELKKRLISENRIYEIDWNSNLYDFIGVSRYVICMPGTAPAIIAKELNIPVISLYLGDNVLCDPYVDYGIPVFQNVEEASKYIISTIR
jgi:polysaccharide biosynthesis PFTS motif protein